MHVLYKIPTLYENQLQCEINQSTRAAGSGLERKRKKILPKTLCKVIYIQYI